VTRSLLLLLALGPLSALAEDPAQPPPPAEPPGAEKDDQSLEQYRTPFEVLGERMIGAASKSVRFDWRRTTAGFGIVGSELLERNNFGSTRLGGFARRPVGGFLGEVAVTWVNTWATDSTRKLALTPYRQHGRPSRLELDVNLGFPLAEGVVTAWPSFFPATEVVLSANAGARYLFYPGALGGASFFTVSKAVISPRLTEHELDKLEAKRPGGMQIDTGRYGLLTGMSADLYFKNGGFISPRVLVSVPIFSTVTGSNLGWWWELTLGLGWAF
jgi:hypothetical protein